MQFRHAVTEIDVFMRFPYDPHGNLKLKSKFNLKPKFKGKTF